MTQVIISPALDGSPLNGGLATLPNGYVHDGHLWLWPHVNTIFDTWKPSTKWKNTGWSETTWLYKLRLDQLGENEPAEFVAQVSPGTGFFGVGKHAQDSMGCVGGNGKFYATALRTQGFSWVNGDFDNVYLGAARSPEGPYRWQRSPILAASTVGNHKIAWLNTVGLRSRLVDPPPPLGLFPELLPQWGYQAWGFVESGGHPGKLARFQFADEANDQLAPGHKTTSVVALADDGTWRPVRSGGVLDFIPYDAGQDFAPHGATSIFHDPQRGWAGAGYATRIGLPTDPGPDITRAAWYADPKSQFHNAPWANRSAVPVVVGMGGGWERQWEGFRTKQACLIGIFFQPHDGKLWMIRGSAERGARDQPRSWWNPWIMAEVVVDEVTL